MSAGDESYPGELDVLGRSSGRAHHRGFEAETLLDRRADQGRFGAEAAQFVGMCEQEGQRDRQEAAGRVVPGEQEVGDHRHEFIVGQSVARLLGGDECTEKIVARCSTSTLDEGADVLLQRSQAHLEPTPEFEIDDGGEREPKIRGPAREALVLVIGDREHVAHHADRKMMRVVTEEIDLTSLEMWSEHLIGDAGDRRFQLLHPQRRECPRHQSS